MEVVCRRGRKKCLLLNRTRYFFVSKFSVLICV
jgi:hypothetical protein